MITMKREIPFISVSKRCNVLMKAPYRIMLSTIKLGILNGKLMRLLSGLAILLIPCILFAGDLLAKNIVINEFDLNPAGKDAGNEWVVLYNSDETYIDISSWILETTHGEKVTIRIPQGTVMPPKGYWTYIYEKQWLDNNDETVSYTHLTLPTICSV